MAISERVDLVGNVSGQARQWAKEIGRLTIAMRDLAAIRLDKNTTRAFVAGSRAEEQKARAIREQAKSAAALARSSSSDARAQASIARAQQAQARAQIAAYRAQGKPKPAQLAKSTAGSATGPKNDYRYTLQRQEKGGVGGMVNSAIGNFAADAAMNAMSTLAGLMQSMASTFVQAQVFREQSLAGLTILTKSGSEAKKIWDESFALARQTGTTQQEAMSAIQSMMSTGFKKADAAEMYKLMTAMTVVNPAANLEGIARAMAQIKMKGKLQAEELTGQLAEAGVNTELVYKALERRLGKTRAQVLAMQQAGQISSDVGLEAIKDAMRETVGGDVEGTLAKKAGGIGSILSRLQAAPMTFFAGLEQDPALMEKMKGSLTGLVDLLDPTTEKGKKAAASFSKMIDAIAGPGADLFARLADGAPEFLESATKMGKDLGPIVSLIGLCASQVLWLASGIGTLVEKLDSINFDFLFGFAPALVAWIGEVTGLFSTAGSTMASNLISGLTNGIFGGQSSVVSAIMSMATTAIGAGNAAFQIRSPSRVFKAMGKWIPAGLAKGVEANMGVVERSSQAMAGAAVGSAGGALPFVGKAYADAGAGAVNKTISMGGVRQQNVFNLGSERDSAAAEIGAIQKRIIQQEIQAFFGKQAEAA